MALAPSALLFSAFCDASSNISPQVAVHQRIEQWNHLRDALLLICSMQCRTGSVEERILEAILAPLVCSSLQRMLSHLGRHQRT